MQREFLSTSIKKTVVVKTSLKENMKPEPNHLLDGYYWLVTILLLFVPMMRRFLNFLLENIGQGIHMVFTQCAKFFARILRH
jgi:hypothetical protein